MTEQTERIDCRTVDEFFENYRYFHPNARVVDTCSDGCCDYYECPYCGTEWMSELPE